MIVQSFSSIDHNAPGEAAIRPPVTAERRNRFVTRYLDPSSRLGEILFGLIMVLTITLTAGITMNEGRAGVRQLLAAAIGCNIAWGLIDAVMYLMNCLTVRTEKMRLVESVQCASSEASALRLVQEGVEPELQEFLEPAEAEAFGRTVLKHIARARVKKPTLSNEDWLGAIACFWLVFVSCLPAALPFVIFSEPHRALRVSNLLLIALLFFVGFKWARYAGTNRWRAGTTLVAIGLTLVGAAVLLGG